MQPVHQRLAEGRVVAVRCSKKLLDFNQLRRGVTKMLDKAQESTMPRNSRLVS
jgi:hypothetical protein